MVNLSKVDRAGRGRNFDQPLRSAVILSLIIQSRLRRPRPVGSEIWPTFFSAAAVKAERGEEEVSHHHIPPSNASLHLATVAQFQGSMLMLIADVLSHPSSPHFIWREARLNERRCGV